MAEYIEREAAFDAIFSQFCASSDETEMALNNAIEEIKSIPDADVRPVKRGKWEVDGHHIRCSICGEYMCIKDQEGIEIPREFCPNCGASMVSEDG